MDELRQELKAALQEAGYRANHATAIESAICNIDKACADKNITLQRIWDIGNILSEFRAEEKEMI